MQGSNAPDAHGDHVGDHVGDRLGDASGKPDCAETRSHLMTFLDGECTAVVRQTMATHLRECPPCMHRAEFERQVRTLVAVRCRDSAPASLLQRILMHLRDS